MLEAEKSCTMVGRITDGYHTTTDDKSCTMVGRITDGYHTTVDSQRIEFQVGGAIFKI